MSKYTNILCATDFSSNCQATAQRAAEIARQDGAALILLHVVEYYPECHSNRWIEPEGDDPEAYQDEKVRSMLAELARQVDFEAATQEVRFTADAAKHEIIRFAEEKGVDLIVVSSHGRHGTWPMLGATANALVNLAQCDVLVVRAQG
jgi:universal stress protein A